MKILLVNNANDGFADYKNVTDGITLSELLEVEVGDTSNVMARVNREEVPGDHPLKEGDRVVITPTNIEGA